MENSSDQFLVKYGIKHQGCLWTSISVVREKRLLQEILTDFKKYCPCTLKNDKIDHYYFICFFKRLTVVQYIFL